MSAVIENHDFLPRGSMSNEELPSSVTATVNLEAQATVDHKLPATTIRAEISQEEQERAAGITTLISPDAPGFQCVFKQRYTDFQVNEILTSGEVLHLVDNITAPGKNAKKEKKDALNDVEASQPIADDVLSYTDTGRKRGPETVVDQEPGAESKRVKLEAEYGSQERRANGGMQAITKDRSAEPANEGSAPATEANGDASAHVSTNELIASFDPADKQALDDIFGQDVTRQIFELYSAVLQYPQRKPRDQITVKSAPIESKTVRTQAHGVVRKLFSSRLETLTLQDEPGRMSIRAAAPKGQQQQNGRNSNKDKGAHPQARTRLDWNELGGQYLHFTLYKENKDTMEVLYFMASELKIKVANFQFAGTKDRRGVTVQKVAAYRVQKERLTALTRIARGWKIGGFEYKKHGIQLGDLKGNEFVLTLRDIQVKGPDGALFQNLDEARKSIETAASAFAKHGFINFYGLQRFGAFKTGTHMTGMKMIQGDLEGAINGILAYDEAVLSEDTDVTANVPKDDIDRARAIHTWRTKGNANKIRDQMPRRFQAESNLIQYLSRKQNGKLTHERDLQGALMTIQRGLRLMYVHAYQSYVWNTVAGERWRLHRAKVVEGDLVVIGEKDTQSTDQIKDQIDQDGEIIVHASASAEEGDLSEDAFVRARPLTKEEAESNKYDIYDVVLPLPGWDVVYPSNEIGTFYKTFMASEKGGQIDPHDMRRAWKDVSLSGGYRKMMARPLDGNVGVSVHAYRGEEQLAATDADNLGISVYSGKPAESTGEDEQEKLAVVMRFQLSSSQYATMALRELTKGGARAYKPEFSVAR